MSAVFDDPANLERYRTTGAFPEIHTPMATLIKNAFTGCRLADLCCCHGLLGAQVGAVLGIEAEPKYITEAAAAGVPLKIINLAITRYTLPELSAALQEHQVTGVILRRAMPELWGKDPEGAELFANTLAKAGIRTIFIQCRRPTRNPATAFTGLESEIAPFLCHYNTVHNDGQLSLLIIDHESL